MRGPLADGCARRVASVNPDLANKARRSTAKLSAIARDEGAGHGNSPRALDPFDFHTTLR